MRGLIAAGLLIWLLLGTLPAQAHTLSTTELAGVGFEPHLGDRVPLDLTFQDENGQAVRLADALGQRPVILTLNYLTCPNLCPLTVQNLAGSLSDVPFTLGDQFSVLTVSIDPTDTSALAHDKKAEFLRPYARPGLIQGTANGWHFLTGDQASIDRLTDAVGFHYVYDPDQHEYAHPAGAIVLTPGGQIARYLYGLDFPPNDLRLALVEASQEQIATPTDRLLLLCYHYDPETGRYSSQVLGAVRAGGIATLVGLGLMLGMLWRRDLLGPGSGPGKGGPL